MPLWEFFSTSLLEFRCPNFESSLIYLSQVWDESFFRNSGAACF